MPKMPVDDCMVKAVEMVEVLKIWGMTKNDAWRVSRIMANMIGEMSMADWSGIAPGVTIKPPTTEGKPN